VQHQEDRTCDRTATGQAVDGSRKAVSVSSPPSRPRGKKKRRDSWVREYYRSSCRRCERKIDWSIWRTRQQARPPKEDRTLCSICIANQIYLDSLKRARDAAERLYSEAKTHAR
jgi:hypothetical protein